MSNIVNLRFMQKIVLLAKHNNINYVGVDSICDFIGIKSKSQKEKILNNPSLKEHSIRFSVKNDKGLTFKKLFFDENKIYSWLKTIDKENLNNDQKMAISHCSSYLGIDIHKKTSCSDEVIDIDLGSLLSFKCIIEEAGSHIEQLERLFKKLVGIGEFIHEQIDCRKRTSYINGRLADGSIIEIDANKVGLAWRYPAMENLINELKKWNKFIDVHFQDIADQVPKQSNNIHHLPKKMAVG